eukprot:tig00000073_g1687.t1
MSRSEKGTGLSMFPVDVAGAEGTPGGPLQLDLEVASPTPAPAPAPAVVAPRLALAPELEAQEEAAADGDLDLVHVFSFSRDGAADEPSGAVDVENSKAPRSAFMDLFKEPGGLRLELAGIEPAVAEGLSAKAKSASRRSRKKSHRPKASILRRRRLVEGKYEVDAERGGAGAAASAPKRVALGGDDREAPADGSGSSSGGESDTPEGAAQAVAAAADAAASKDGATTARSVAPGKKAKGRPRSLGGPEAQRDAADVIFHKMNVRYMIAFAVLTLLAVGSFLATYFIVSNSVAASTVIKARAPSNSLFCYAGRRRALTRAVSFLAREVYLDDGSLGTKADNIDMLAKYITDLRVSHESLKYGNDTAKPFPLDNAYARSPKQLELMYGSGCLLLDGKCTAARAGYLAPYVNSGLDFGFQAMIGFAKTMLKENEYYTPSGAVNAGAWYRSSTTPRPWYPARKMAATNQTCCLSALSIHVDSVAAQTFYDLTEYLGEGMERSQAMMYADAQSDLSLNFVVCAVVLGIQLFSLSVVYLAVFRPIIQQLTEECGRSAELLHMVPKDWAPLLRALEQVFRPPDPDQPDP